LAAPIALAAAAEAEVPAAVGSLAPAPPGMEAREIAKRAEDALRGSTTFMRATMTVESPRLPGPRAVRFESWEDRPSKRSFIRILKPPKDAGMAFLKLPPNLWNYIPRVERTIRIPPSMMLQSWMGSDFTNDDLVRESSVLDDYAHQLLGMDEVDGAPAYVVEYVPHEDAPVVWGRIVGWIGAERFAPLRQDYYDEDGSRLRVMVMREVRDVQGRPFPHAWDLVPLDKEGHATRIAIEEVRFDVEFEDAVFTKRNLRRRD